MNKIIEIKIDSLLDGIDIEKVVNDEEEHSILMEDLIRVVESQAECWRVSKSDVYEYVGKLLYK